MESGGRGAAGIFPCQDTKLQDTAAEPDQARRHLERVVDQRNAAEERVRALQEENATLLREIPRRVSAGLGFMAGLLSLQMKYVDHPGTRHLLEETRKRITTLASVHEHIYTADDISSIELRDYLGTLIGGLLCSTGISRKHVEFIVLGPTVTVRPDTAIPLGLVLYELAEDAIEKRDTKGNGDRMELRIEESPGILSITFSFSTFSSGFPMREAGLTPFRLLLVTSLMEQIGGTFSLTSDRKMTSVIRLDNSRHRATR